MAIIVSTLVSYYALDDISLTPQFVVGGVVVLAAVFLYNLSWVRTLSASRACRSSELFVPFLLR